jgi:predicted Zn-dependent peptidase
MKRMLSMVLVASASWIGPVAIAQAPRPEVAAPRRFTPPRAIESSLPNGLTVTLVPYGTMPTARVELVIRAGTADETAGQVGLAELVGDYLREGSRSRNADSLARETSGLGVVGGEIGILVRPFVTWVGGEVLSESTLGLVDLIGDLVRQPAFAPGPLARLKANQVRRLSMRRTQAATLASTRVNTLLFPNHPSDRIPTDEQVQGLALDDVQRFHATHFVARRAHLYIAGVFDAPAVEAAVRRAFGAWAPGEAKPVVLDAPLQRSDPRTNQPPVIHLMDRPGASQARIQVSAPVVDPAHPDHPILNLLNVMLGWVQTSRIIANVRERHGYSYNVSSRLVRRPGSSQWALTADVANDVTGAALREILAELARVVAEPPADEELRRHQAFSAGVLIAENATPAGILDTLRYFDLYGVDAEYRANFVERTRDIVPADIQRVARTYFQPHDLVIVVVGDRAAVASQLASVGKITD